MAGKRAARLPAKGPSKFPRKKAEALAELADRLDSTTRAALQRAWWVTSQVCAEARAVDERFAIAQRAFADAKKLGVVLSEEQRQQAAGRGEIDGQRATAELLGEEVAPDLMKRIAGLITGLPVLLLDRREADEADRVGTLVPYLYEMTRVSLGLRRVTAREWALSAVAFGFVRAPPDETEWEKTIVRWRKRRVGATLFAVVKETTKDDRKELKTVMRPDGKPLRRPAVPVSVVERLLAPLVGLRQAK